LNYAFRLMMLPLGVFGVAVATVTLPVVSKIAATMDWESFRNTLSKALRLGAFLAIPSAAGLAMLAEPVIGLIYERGRFGWTDTLATAGALRFYALGLIGYCMVKVLAPAFYAMDRKWTPMTVSFASIAINCTLNYILIFEVGWGHRGLALSTAISATFNAVLLYVILRRHTGGLRSAYFLRQLTAYTMGAAGLCVTAWLWTHYAEAWLLRSELWVRLPAVLASIATSGGVYLLICWVLRVEEIHEIKAILLRRLRRG
jgi:putative peptidoglycan lipid II flippase